MPGVRAAMDGEGGSFARCLAHSTDPSQRARGLAALAAWLQQRPEVSDLDLLKIWKALFFCVWHCDKRESQNKLNEELGGLMEGLPFPSSQIFFFTFITTLRREWARVDKHRLDKFLALSRTMLRKEFRMLKSKKWEKKAVEEFSRNLLQRCLLPEDELPADGLSMHVCDVFLHELSGVEPELADKVLVKLLDPFLKTLGASSKSALKDRVESSVFNRLLGESPVFQLTDRQLYVINEMIFDLAANELTLSQNRARLYNMHAHFKREILDCQKMNDSAVREIGDRKAAAALPDSSNLKMTKKRKASAKTSPQIATPTKQQNTSPALTRSSAKKKKSQVTPPRMEDTTVAKASTEPEACTKTHIASLPTERTRPSKQKLPLTNVAGGKKTKRSHAAMSEQEQNNSSPGSARQRNRVRFSLDRNMVKLFRKDSLPSTPTVLSPLQTKGVLKKATSSPKASKPESRVKNYSIKKVPSKGIKLKIKAPVRK